MNSSSSSDMARQRLVPSQVRGGFIDLLKESQRLFEPSDRAFRVLVLFDDETTPTSVNVTGWKHNTPMITGLASWFRKNRATTGDVIVIKKLAHGLYQLSFISRQMETLKESGKATSESHGLKVERPSLEKNEGGSDDYVVRKIEGDVLVASKKRLPFEPTGSILDLRNEIRRALLCLRGSGDKTGLYGCYYSTLKDKVDTENVLFYNVGMSYFSPLKPSSIMFERSYQNPSDEGSIPGGAGYHHFQRYSTSQFKLRHWKLNPVSSFTGFLPANYMSRELKPDHVWFAIRTGNVQALSQSRIAGHHLGVEITITLPKNQSPRLVYLLKPLLDGTIAVFHSQSQVDDAVLRIVGSRIGVDAQTIRHLLEDERNALLGSTQLIRAWGNSVQWNPADDRLVAARVSVIESDEEPWKITGQLCLATPGEDLSRKHLFA